jgi:TolA-binding protein
MRRWLLSAFIACLATASAAPVSAITEADRLWLVGERAFADGLHVLARRALERFIAEAPKDARVPEAVLLLGRTRLALGNLEPALEAFRRAQGFASPPARLVETKFWEAETLFRLKRFAEARTAYDEVVRTDAASPLAPASVYGLAWSELELRQPDAAIAAFREFLKAWPDHALAASAAFQLGRTLAELRRFAEVVPVLQAFVGKYPNHKFLPEARYLLGISRVSAGDARGGVTDLRGFIEAYPAHDLTPAAWRILIDAMARSSDPHDLQEAYKALMEQTPATLEGLVEAAVVASRLGRPQDQEAAWRRLVKEFPESPQGRRAALDLAAVTFNRNHWKDTVGYAQVAAQSDDEGMKAEAWLLAGEAELKLRRFGPAARAFEASLAVQSTDAMVRYRALAGLGLALEEQRDFKGALSAYESVATMSPDATLRDWAKGRAKVVKARQAPAPPVKPKAGS